MNTSAPSTYSVEQLPVRGAKDWAMYFKIICLLNSFEEYHLIQTIREGEKLV